MGCDWKRLDMAESFIKKYFDVEEVLINDYYEKILKKELNNDELIIYKGLKRLKRDYYSTIAYLLGEYEDCIKCPTCENGYATINAGEDITCNWCTHQFFPKYDWVNDKQLYQEVDAFIKSLLHYKELDLRKKRIQESVKA